MGYNGSGLFEIDTAGQPVVSDTVIDPDVFNALTADVATGLSTCITKDGQTTVTANIPMGTYKITGLGAATARTDAASLANIQDGAGVYVGTVGGSANAITLTPSPAITAYVAGQRFSFIAGSTNTGDTTVAVSGLAAKTIQKTGHAGASILFPGDITAPALTVIEYDGTSFNLLSPSHPQETTWTPSVGGTATYTVQVGRAWRSGMLICVTCALTINAIGTGSTTLISGLPKAYYGTGTAAVYFTSSSTNVTSITAMTANTTDIALYSTTVAQTSMASNAIFKNGTAINFSMWYLTTA